MSSHIQMRVNLFVLKDIFLVLLAVLPSTLFLKAVIEAMLLLAIFFLIAIQWDEPSWYVLQMLFITCLNYYI